MFVSVVFCVWREKDRNSDIDGSVVEWGVGGVERWEEFRGRITQDFPAMKEESTEEGQTFLLINSFWQRDNLYTRRRKGRRCKQSMFH